MCISNLIFLDEVTGSLDATNTVEVCALISGKFLGVAQNLMTEKAQNCEGTAFGPENHQVPPPQFKMVVEGRRSEGGTMLSSVSQSSAFGPILLIVLINDLRKGNGSSPFHLSMA